MHIPCAQITALGTSLSGLAHMNASSGASSASQVSSELKQLQSQLKGLKGQASGAFASQESQLTAALSEVKAAAQGITGGSPSAAQLTALATALRQLKNVVQPIVTEIRAACGG